MTRNSLIRILPYLLILGLISETSSGNITPLKREGSGNHISVTPINGLETSTYSFCLHLIHPAQ